MKKILCLKIKFKSYLKLKSNIFNLNINILIKNIKLL